MRLYVLREERKGDVDVVITKNPANAKRWMETVMLEQAEGVAIIGVYDTDTERMDDVAWNVDGDSDITGHLIESCPELC